MVSSLDVEFATSLRLFKDFVRALVTVVILLIPHKLRTPLLLFLALSSLLSILLLLPLPHLGFLLALPEILLLLSHAHSLLVGRLLRCLLLLLKLGSLSSLHGFLLPFCFRLELSFSIGC